MKAPVAPSRSVSSGWGTNGKDERKAVPRSPDTPGLTSLRIHDRRALFVRLRCTLATAILIADPGHPTGLTMADSTHRFPNLLTNRNFVLLWCAYGISALGDHLSEMAILKTQDALAEGAEVTQMTARMTFMFFVPFLMLAPITGLLADRLPRRGIMVIADLARCGLMFCFATLIAWTTPLGAWGPFVPLLLVGIFAALFSPARAALLPAVVGSHQLVRANGMISGLGIIATMVAAVLGGYLADHYHPVVAFRWDALTFAASAILLILLIPPAKPVRHDNDRPEHAPLDDLVAGFRYTRHHRHVRELIAVAVVIWFCGPLVNSVIPAVVRDVYHGQYTAISGMRGFLGLGFVLGATTITALGNALRSEVAITWGLLGISVAILVFGLTTFLGQPIPTTPVCMADMLNQLPWVGRMHLWTPGQFTSMIPLSKLYWVGAVAVTFAGLFAMAVMASFTALLQKTVSDRFLGRVFGVKDLLTTAALLIATGALGVPAWTNVDRWVGYILIGVAVVILVAGVVTLRTRLRRTTVGPWLTFLEHLNEFIAKSWWGMRLEGRGIPREGPVLITANHVSSPDPLLLAASSPYRPIAFMIAAEYASLPIASHFTGLVDCIPVRRDGQDTSATKQALRHLKSGNALGIFIQGTISPPGQVALPKDGVALLAMKTGATVIPAFISGTNYTKSLLWGFCVRHRARLRIGRPVDLSDISATMTGRDAVRAATVRIWQEILALAPQDGIGHVDGIAETKLPKSEHES